jgi:hypothetical protein
MVNPKPYTCLSKDKITLFQQGSPFSTIAGIHRGPGAKVTSVRDDRCKVNDFCLVDYFLNPPAKKLSFKALLHTSNFFGDFVFLTAVHFLRILQQWGKTAKGPIFLVLPP